MQRFGHGEEIVVDRNGQTVAIIRPVEPEPRTLSELIELAMLREKERGYAVTLDEDYAADVEQIVRARKPLPPRSGANPR